MDGTRFDALARSLALPGSRRRLFGALGAGFLAALGFGDGAAARGCRAVGRSCREGANCCSGLCKGDVTGRRACRCVADTDCPTPCGTGPACAGLAACEVENCRRKACWIGGEVVPAGTRNPADPCQICNPDRNWDRWSGVPNGDICPPPDPLPPCKSNFVATCQNGVCVPMDAADGSSCGDSEKPCLALVCRAGDCQEEPANDGADCDNGVNDVCVNRFGTCEAGVCVGRQEPDGSSCGFDRVCCAGNCVQGQQCGDPGGGCEGDECAGTCLIDGVVYDFGDHNPENHCEICAESSESPTTSWQPAIDDNTACGEPPVIRACCGGVCCLAGECCGTDSDGSPVCTSDCPPPSP